MAQNGSSDSAAEQKKKFAEIKDLYPEGFKPYFFEKRDFYIAGGLFLLSFIVYLLTITPFICAGDSGELTTAIYNLGAAHPPGYPLYTMLGKIFTYVPVSTIAYRVNLLSAFFAALTIPFLFLFLLKLLRCSEKKESLPMRDYLIASSCSLMFAFSQTMWSQAVIAEVYSLNIVFAPLLLLAVLVWQERVFVAAQHGQVAFAERYMLLFALLLGMSFTNHLLLMGYIIPFVAFFAAVLIFVYQYAPKERVGDAQKIIIVALVVLAAGIAGYGIYKEAWSVALLDDSNALYTLLAVVAPAIVLGGVSCLLMAQLPDKKDFKAVERAKNFFVIAFVALTAAGGAVLFFDSVKNRLNFMDSVGNFEVLVIALYLCGLAIVLFSYFALRKQHARLSYFTNTVTLIFKSYLVLLIPMLLYLTLVIRANAIAKMPDPPLSWGETANASRVLNHFLRKQYPKAAMRFGKVFFDMIGASAIWHGRQFTPWLWLLVPFGLFGLYRKNRLWAGLTVLIFLFFNLLLLGFLSFKVTPRDMSFNEVFFIPSYVLVATWIAFGMQFIVKSLVNLIGKKEDGEMSALSGNEDLNNG